MGFCCFSLALTSMISLSRTIQMAHLTSWGQGTWEAYLMKIIVPDTLSLCKDINNKENERDCKQGPSNLVKGKHYYTRHMINIFLNSRLELPQNEVMILYREPSSDMLDLDTPHLPTPPPSCFLLQYRQERVHIICACILYLLQCSLNQICTWKIWELISDVTWETTAFQDYNITMFSSLRTTVNEATGNMLNSSQTLVDIVRLTSLH